MRGKLVYKCPSQVKKKSYNKSSVPLSIFSVSYDLVLHKNEIKTNLGLLKIYSSSNIVFDRIIFNFILIFFASVINISILFFSFIWAFDRFLSVPLTELISQVDDLRMNRKTGRRINLPVVEDNEAGVDRYFSVGSLNVDRRRMPPDIVVGFEHSHLMPTLQIVSSSQS